MRTKALIALLCATHLACSGDSEPGAAGQRPRLRLWHTFNAGETQALNRELATRGAPVETTLLPFSRAQLIVRDTLREAGDDCPDLVRIDATWLPGLAADGLLRPAPEVADRAWLDEAAELARYGAITYGYPQAIDGLVVLYNRALVDAGGVRWPPERLSDLVASARALTLDGRYGLWVRVDGYWFVAFLRAAGGAVIEPETGRLGIDEPVAAQALARFGDLFASGVAPRPPAPGDEAPTMERRFRAGQVAIVVDGPWAVAGLRNAAGAPLGVAPFPRAPDGSAAAPFGGQLFVVPACARHPDEAWALAHELTAPAVQATWADELGLVPTTREGLAAAGAFTRELRAALQAARPLPRHPATTELFDDLTPAVAAVVAQDAAPDEALAGVARAWSRILRRHGIEPKPYEALE